MPSQKNINQLSVINDKLEKSQNVVLADYSGLSVADQTELRSRIVAAGGEFTVQKNRLVKIALTQRLQDIPDSLINALNGPTAVIYSYEDAVSATKILVEFSKENDNLTIKAGVLKGNEDVPDTILTLDQIQDLATLPSRDQLRAKLVGQLQAPISGFVNVLAGNMRSLVQILTAIKDQQPS